MERGWLMTAQSEVSPAQIFKMKVFRTRFLGNPKVLKSGILDA
jgi:hypothetical protein